MAWRKKVNLNFLIFNSELSLKIDLGVGGIFPHIWEHIKPFLKREYARAYYDKLRIFWAYLEHICANKAFHGQFPYLIWNRNTDFVEYYGFYSFSVFNLKYNYTDFLKITDFFFNPDLLITEFECFPWILASCIFLKLQAYQGYFPSISISI